METASSMSSINFQKKKKSKGKKQKKKKKKKTKEKGERRSWIIIDIINYRCRPIYAKLLGYIVCLLNWALTSQSDVVTFWSELFSNCHWQHAFFPPSPSPPSPRMFVVYPQFKLNSWKNFTSKQKSKHTRMNI